MRTTCLNRDGAGPTFSGNDRAGKAGPTRPERSSRLPRSGSGVRSAEVRISFFAPFRCLSFGMSPLGDEILPANFRCGHEHIARARCLPEPFSVSSSHRSAVHQSRRSGTVYALMTNLRVRRARSTSIEPRTSTKRFRVRERGREQPCVAGVLQRRIDPGSRAWCRLPK